ncbi:MAG: cell division protein SepF, partial [Candidatus Nanopelagicales bacterium]
MAGAMRKMAVYLGLVEDDPDRNESYFEEDEWEYDDEPAPTRRSRSSERERSSRQAERAEPRTVTVVDPREPRRLYRDEQPSNVSPMPSPGARPARARPAHHGTRE